MSREFECLGDPAICDNPRGCGCAPERTYTRAELLAALAAERHACSIVVWMVLMEALEDDADDKGLDGWMREAESRVKNRWHEHETKEAIKVGNCPTCHGTGIGGERREITPAGTAE